jgi:DNA-binding ferritin-like protein (Dps family)
MKVEDRLLKYLEHKKKKNFDEIQDRENHLASSYRSRSKSSIKSYRSGVSPTGMGKLKSKEETMTP